MTVSSVSPSVYFLDLTESQIAANGQLDVTCVAFGNPVPDITVYCDNIMIASSDDKNYKDSESFGSSPNVSQTVQLVASEADGINQCHCNASSFNGESDDIVTASAVILPGQYNYEATYYYDYYSDHYYFPIIIIIIIIVPAMILSFLPDEPLTVSVPLKIELSCKGRGRPAPNLTWYKGGKEILSDSNHGMPVNH